MSSPTEGPREGQVAFYCCWPKPTFCRAKGRARLGLWSKAADWAASPSLACALFLSLCSHNTAAGPGPAPPLVRTPVGSPVGALSGHQCAARCLAPELTGGASLRDPAASVRSSYGVTRGSVAGPQSWRKDPRALHSLCPEEAEAPVGAHVPTPVSRNGFLKARTRPLWSCPRPECQTS